MIAEGMAMCVPGAPGTEMEEWLANPSLMSADADAEYAAIIEIDLADINEPIVCCPNDPDDARLLSEVGRQSRRDFYWPA